MLIDSACDQAGCRPARAQARPERRLRGCSLSNSASCWRGNLFIGARLAKASVEQISVAVIPFCVAYMLSMAFVVALPQVVVWLPNLVFGVGK